jgi:SulP family sulfate permease
MAEGYNTSKLIRDVLAGMTVGIIAIPLAMALAIASGVPPQYGLYTAIIGGFIIALTGGSRFSISGPTAAFVVILYPIAQRYGLGGLLLATVMSGMILVGLALLRLGRLIEYIPESVTLGFTGGIAVVIAVLQVKDLFGLPLESMPEHTADKVWLLGQSMQDLAWPSFLVAVMTFAVMLLWPRLRSPVPAHLPAIVVGTLIAWWLNSQGWSVDTIGSRFTYSLADGTVGQGIPPALPDFAWPWQRPGVDGLPVGLSWALVIELLPAAFAIAMLGAIESLLCAVVLDGMSGHRHSANSELLGQGIGNMIVPFFGGITATAAIARSAANFKSGAVSPIAGMVHAGVVLLGLVVLAPFLAWLPMPAMAALLLMVAWNMSEAPKAVHLLKTAPKGDVWVFLACFSLTVLVDMVMAITVGILLAAVLFVKEIAEMTRVNDISQNRKQIDGELPDGWTVLKINGPLFFAAADRVFGEMAQLCHQRKGIVLYMDGVPILDAGGLAALEKLIAYCGENNTLIYIADLQFQPLKTLARARVRPVPGVSQYFPTLKEALVAVRLGDSSGQ